MLKTNETCIFFTEKLQSGFKVPTEELNLPVCLPVTNIQDLKLLEDALKDENMQEYLVSVYSF